MRLLLDQGLPHTATALLRAAGWDVVHATELQMSRAADSEILERARLENRVVCTLDADFHALLATSGHGAPSVIRIRREGLKAKDVAGLLLAIWPKVEQALARGAMITVSEESLRIRYLPVEKTRAGLP